MDDAHKDDVKQAARQAALFYHEFPRPGKLEIRATKPLANGRDRVHAADTPQWTSPQHAHVRGPGYYQ